MRVVGLVFAALLCLVTVCHAQQTTYTKGQPIEYLEYGKWEPGVYEYTTEGSTPQPVIRRKPSQYFPQGDTIAWSFDRIRPRAAAVVPTRTPTPVASPEAPRPLQPIAYQQPWQPAPPALSVPEAQRPQNVCAAGNGGNLQFNLGVNAQIKMNFDFGLRVMAEGVAKGTVTPVRTSAPGLVLTNFANSAQPMLNGHVMKLATNEICYSAAVAPDGKLFALGSSLFLRFVDAARGGVRWGIRVPGAVSVNISADGRFVMAGLVDGTIRWYRATDGKEVLAFTASADRRKWIMWSPTGYYDASAGGEDLIGFSVKRTNGGGVDYFPASRFQKEYNRPDVIDKILETADESKAVVEANADLPKKPAAPASIEKLAPPVVQILSPKDGSDVTTDQVTVQYTVRTPSGAPVKDIKILVDGRPVEKTRDLQVVARDDTQRTATLAIPAQDCTVSIVAANAMTSSEPAIVHLKRKGAVKPDDGFVIQPKLYILAVGVSKYPRPEWVLHYSAKDAQDFCASMERQKGRLYREVVVKLLTDEKATRDEIVDGLDWIRKETTAKDVAMVFLSGHGMNDNDGSYYFVPVNFDPDKIKRTGLPGSEVRATLAQVAGKALFFFDSCHSGNVLGTGKTRALEVTAVVNELVSADNGAVVFAASTGRQVALEDPSWSNGAFTKALVEGLNGQADMRKSGRITVNMLDLYISERVKELTKGKQTPTTAKPATVPDFPVSIPAK